ncbi:class I SAM-dependent methyltransferase [Brevibacillus agri]|uniref:class I SAM-dependent methyltransferase n=1 Tax=Brevibacillus agri TaxID=51101 RepID=UPI0024C054B6|nr:SAM-dependent methyltransferase [Brevibacillus agri]WHX28972.1 SAM-dependent methyltransferase [Brevibacillus agri]
MDIIAQIRHEIESQEGRAISFSRFMELALYHDAYGYYMSDLPKVGKDGDFFTSTTVHAVFGETLADAVSELWRAAGIKQPVLVEIGGGTGSLCSSMLGRIRESAPDVYKRLKVVLIEASPYHRRRQEEALREHEVEKVWHASLADAACGEAVEGVVLSNEWLDAFPVHVAERTKTGWQEVAVTCKEGQFCEVLREPTAPLLAALAEIEAALPIPAGMRIEVNLGLKQAAQEVGRLLAKGFVVTIDYGDRQEELYHPSRKKGTLMCYYRHQAHDNPYIHVGEQDITAHVNFSAWSRYGEAAGLQEVCYMRQDKFLLQCGLLHKAVAHQDTDPFTSKAMKRNRAILQLIDPAGLGGRFRVMVQQKGMEPNAAALPAFFRQ